MIRRLLLALIAGLLAASPASALTLAVKQALGPPGWVLSYQPGIQFDFARGAAWKGTWSGGGAVVAADAPDMINDSRASVCMIDDLAGRWREVPANTICRSDRGLTVWEAKTNLALWSRDWTNAAWVKFNATAALTATGIDGAANSATTITATGALATVLQTIVQASTADTGNFFVRRRTGSGTIEATVDGATYTDITAAVAAALTSTPGGFYRPIISATLVNPVIGLRLTTSGDAVDVDFAGLSAGLFAGMPIATTTVAVTSATDQTNFGNLPVVWGSHTLYARATPAAPTAYAANQALISASTANSQDRTTIVKNTTTATHNYQMRVANVAQYSVLSVAWPQNTTQTLMLAVAPGDQRGAYAGVLVTAGTFATLPLPPISVNPGGGVGSSFNGLIIGAAVFPSRIPDFVMRDQMTQ